MDDDSSSSQPNTTLEELIGHFDDSQSISVQKLRKKKNIPIPVTLDVTSYADEVSDDFVIPTSYVRFQNVPLVNEEQKVEIDLELAEIKWLKYHPKYGETGDPRYQISLDTFAHMLDCLEKASAMINPNIITLAEAEEVFSKQLGMVKTPLNRVTVDVYNYWAQKRMSLQRPLLRKFWPQTPLNDTNPHLVFRPREKERYKLRKHRKNDMEGYRKLLQLRHDFEQIRHLLELVKRREKAKRLEIEFLDEIRVQAIHELTHPPYLYASKENEDYIRKPNIPFDIEERERRERKRNKKKLKKKFRRGSDEYEDGGSIFGSTDGISSTNIYGSTECGNALSNNNSSSPTTLSGTPIRTFMDYDTSGNFRLRDPENMDPDLRMPYYPSYPLPPSHILASIFSHPPKYRCRGRVGRGGRFIIDRIPVPNERYYAPNEVTATPLDPSKKKMKSNNSINSLAGDTMAAPSPAASAVPTIGEAINAGHHSAILVHETAFVPLKDKIETLTTTRLQEIYAMSDSEDEMIEPLTSAVYENASAKKPVSVSNSINSNTGSKVGSSTRAIKYTIDI